MSATCSRCGKFLPDVITWAMGGPEPADAWHMENAAPNGAANHGPSVMIPVCNKCSPMIVTNINTKDSACAGADRTDEHATRTFADVLRKWWSFDDHQIHTHSWHTREDFIEKKLPELLVRFSSNKGASVRGTGTGT